MRLIIKRILTWAVLPAAIVVLAYYNVMTIMAPLEFENSRAAREEVAIQRLKDIRTLQELYKSINGRYVSTIDSLKMFYNEGVLPVLYEVGERDDSIAVLRTDEIIKSLKNDSEFKAILKKAPKEKHDSLISRELYRIYKQTNANIVFSIDSLMPVRDTLFGGRPDFCIDSLAFIPFSGGDSVQMASKMVDDGGYMVSLFEAKMPYSSLLKGLDEQLVVNLIAERDSAKRYPGLKVGDIEKKTNNPGNWE